MATLDEEELKLVVRIVYDGPAFAGKTTNLQQLCQFFTTRRRSELVTPEIADGRTAYFDWLLLDGGLVAGFPLRCQLVTVPGQSLLAPRRWHAIGTADAVVFVCDSTPAGVEEARAMLSQLRAYMLHREGKPLPLVVQANKQDCPGALTPEALAEALSLDEGTVVVAAKALDGTGVRETVVLAIRAAANEAQQAILERGQSTLRGKAGDHEALLSEMRALEVPHRPPSMAPPRAISAAPSLPPLPQPGLPPGHVWPADTGPDIVKRVAAAGDAVHHPSLAGARGTDEGSGRSDVFVFEAGLWCIKTSARRCFDDEHAAVAALRELARRKALLKELSPRRTALALQRDDHGRFWLFTLSPWLTTQRAAMAHAEKHADAEALADALEAYAHAAARSMALAVRDAVALDVHPTNFAMLGDRTYYVDDDVALSRSMPMLGHALLQRVDEYERFASAVDAYVAALSRAIRATLSQDEIDALALVDLLAAASARSDAGARARAALCRACGRGR